MFLTQVFLSQSLTNDTFKCVQHHFSLFFVTACCIVCSHVVLFKKQYGRRQNAVSTAPQVSEFIIKTTLMPQMSQMSGTETEWANLLWCRGTKTGTILTPDWFELLSSYANSDLGTAKVSLTSSNGGERRAAGWAGGQPAGLSGSSDSRRAILAGSASWPSTWT